MSQDSADLLESPSDLNHAFPFPSSYQRRPSRRLSNDSTMSVSSIGGALDTHAARPNNSLREAGQNGELPPFLPSFLPSFLAAFLPPRSHQASYSATAISTLLQPTIVRTGLLTPAASASSTYRPPSTRDIPPVTLTNIPKVDPDSFYQ
jgi:vacuolar protein sorting-associated protein 54